jgi:hypothetical protein
VKTDKAVEKVLPDLESGDAFTRLEAAQRLLEGTMRDFGFRWDGSAEERAAAVARVRTWLADRRKTEGALTDAARKAAAGGKATLDLSQLKGMDPKEVESHLKEILAKTPALAALAMGRAACQACARRPATVEIVVVEERRARRSRRLCEPCAAKG